MFNESIRWIEQSLLDAKIGGEAALLFNIAPKSVRGRSTHQPRWAELGTSYSTISRVARWPWRAAELASSARIA